MTESEKTAPPVSVMYSFGRPDERSNPYVKLLVREAEKQVEVRYFSWSELLLKPPDVLHIHWPETMVRGTTPWKTQMKASLGILYLIVRRLLGTKIVWTAHNPTPHESGGIASDLYCRLVARWCDHRIVINTVDAPPSHSDNVSVVLHGTFHDWYGGYLRASEPPIPPVNLLFAGLIRPYKGVPELIRAFDSARLETPLRLAIRGAVTDENLRKEIEEALAHSSDADFLFEHLDDQHLVEAIDACNLVVLPYRRLHNSGAALLGLSLGRAVLLPAVDVALDLQREMGPEWVYLYDGELNPASLLRAVESFTRDSRPQYPDMSARQWEDAGRVHVDLYQRLSR